MAAFMKFTTNILVPYYYAQCGGQLDRTVNFGWLVCTSVGDCLHLLLQEDPGPCGHDHTLVKGL